MKGPVDRTLVGVGLAVFAVAFVLRLFGLGWGLPGETRFHSLHPDEEVVLAFSQAIEPTRLDFTPGFYNYGTFYLTVMRVVTDVVSGYGGGPQERDGSDRHLAVARFLTGGRLVSAAAGAGAALFVFLALYRRTHLLGACLGAAAMGITPAFVVHSRFATVDALATFFLAGSLYWGIRLFPRAGEEAMGWEWIRKCAVWAGVLAGLSAGTKYTGILALVAFGAAAMVALQGERAGFRWRAVGVATGAGILTFFLSTPGMLLEPAAFWRDFFYEVQHTSTGHGLVFAGTAPGFFYHLSNLVVGYGGLLLFMSLFGLGKGVWRLEAAWLLGPVVLFVLMYVLIGRAEVKFMRYVFPLLPALAMGFGWLMGQGHSAGTVRSRFGVFLGMVSLAGIGGGFAGTANLTRFMMEPDIRDQVGAALREDLGPGTTVGLVKDPWFWTVSLHPLIQAGPVNMRASDRMAALELAAPLRVVRYVPPEGLEARRDWDLRLLTEVRPDYVVFSSFETEGYDRMDLPGARVPDEYAAAFGEYREFMKRLRAEYDLAVVRLPDGTETLLPGSDALFPTGSVHDLMYVRPYVWVWRRKDDAPTPEPGGNGLTSPSTGTSTTSVSTEVPAGSR